MEDVAASFGALLSAVGLSRGADALVAEALRLHTQTPSEPFRLPTSALSKFLRVGLRGSRVALANLPPKSDHTT